MLGPQREFSAQSGSHVPPLHISLVLHVVPHAPQLLRSVCRLAHRSPHNCAPLPQSQSLHRHELAQVFLPVPPHGAMSVGSQSSWFEHADHSEAVPVFESHVRRCFPHLMQSRSSGSLHIWPMQLPHWQSVPQYCTPPFAHARIEPASHAPWFVQLDQSPHPPVLVSHSRLCVPHWSQLRCRSPLQLCPEHSPFQWQLESHVRVPPEPHACVSFGVQSR
jgi:hypothetical protein